MHQIDDNGRTRQRLPPEEKKKALLFQRRSNQSILPPPRYHFHTFDFIKWISFINKRFIFGLQGMARKASKLSAWFFLFLKVINSELYYFNIYFSIRLQNECFIEDASFLASLSSLRRLSLCDIENTRNLHIISVLTNLRSLCLSGYFYTHILSPFTTTTPTTSRTKYSWLFTRN